MIKWNSNHRSYLNEEGLMETNWKNTGGIVVEITYHRKENNFYFFREWDKNRRLVQATCINEEMIHEPKFSAYQLLI
jgi:hypothetical protein